MLGRRRREERIEIRIILPKAEDSSGLRRQGQGLLWHRPYLSLAARYAVGGPTTKQRPLDERHAGILCTTTEHNAELCRIGEAKDGFLSLGAHTAATRGPGSQLIGQRRGLVSTHARGAQKSVNSRLARCSSSCRAALTSRSSQRPRSCTRAS